MVFRIKKIISKIAPGLYSLAGPFVIAFAWNYYHLTSEVRQIELIWLTLLYACLIFLAFFMFKGFFQFLVKKFNGHTFWTQEFTLYFDELFFISSLAFLVLLFQKELLGFIYLGFVFWAIFWRLDFILKKHKEDLIWQAVNRRVFLLAGFIFVLTAIFQYTAYAFYIFDSNAKYHNIVLFRVFSLTMFWLGSFALCSLVYFYFKKSRQLFLFVWLILFWTALFIEFCNTGVVYNSGLYLSPIILSHISFSSLEIFILPILTYLAVYFVLLFTSYLVFKKVIMAHDLTSKRHWLFYNFALLSVAGFSLVAVGSFYNTPEAIMVKNFSNFYQTDQATIELSPVIEKKLKNFGLSYKLDQFYVMRKEVVPEISLAQKWTVTKPNIVFIFLESFSARLTGPYNEKYREVTPGLNDFTQNKNTILFRKVYNASTPTITSLLAGFCSFLPPTGHEEIERERQLKAHHFTCLPQVLKDNGYKNTTFVTAVEKEFANKNTILESMGIDEVYGTQELSTRIKEEPKSWGFSDHQIFPFLLTLMQEKEQPFFIGYSTVDTHPPFNLPKDMTNFGDGKNPVLNAIHTTDDAFFKFWQEFQNSTLADNTVLVIMADHAIFPAAYEKRYFSEINGKTNFYDELFFGMYVPQSVLPEELSVYGSSIDLAPTVLHLLGLSNQPSFEGYSLFGQRKNYSNIIGMHEFGLYLNQESNEQKRQEDFTMPTDVKCDSFMPKSDLLTICELKQYYDWKRQMLLSGRLW